MILYSFHIFNRKGTRLFHQEWVKAKNYQGSPGDPKLLFGLLYSLKSFTQKLDPKQAGSTFKSVRTETYKLHYFETATGLRFALISDPGAPDLRECLRHIYGHIYVEYVSKNAQYSAGNDIDSPLFLAAINRFLTELFLT